MALGTIELSPEEQALLDTIEFDSLKLRERGDFIENSERARALAKSLIARKGIPDQRRLYFTDPDYHVGGRGLSRLQIFERNGTTGDDILTHAHFLPYLWHFINGANLPVQVIASFEAEVANCGMVTSSDIVPLGKHARKLTRSHGLQPHQACDEFYKLALDLGLSTMVATSVRNSVRAAR
jgi:hypothetical protein